jgi:hypothetical protein
MRREAGATAVACSAPDVPRNDDEISGPHPLDAGTAIDHLADTLMTDREREGKGREAGDDRSV